MTALLRFQWVVIVRAVAEAFVVIGAPLAAVGLFLFARASGQLERMIWGGSTFVVLAAFGVWGMNRTLDALDVVRWTAPIGRGLALRSYLLFWLAFWVGLAAVSAAALARHAAHVALLITHAATFVFAATGLLLFQRLVSRVGRGPRVVGVLFGVALSWAACTSFVSAWMGKWEAVAVSGGVAVVACALGVPSFLRGELEPAATGAVVETQAARADERGPVSARTPAWSILRATYGPVVAGVWIVFGGVFPLAFPWFNIAAIWTPLAGSNLAGFGLQSWRWLAATPIDRDRAFRILFGPALVFVLAVTGVRLAIVEATHDRSAFFRDDRREGFEYVGFSTLTLSQILEFGPTGNGYRPAELHRVAAGVRDHLRKEFGVAAAVERIEADLRPGWPEHPTPGATDDDMGYVLDGLERVRVDLADEIVGASRRRDLLIAAGLVLAFLAMLRAQFRGRVVGVVLVILIGLPLVTLSMFRREFPRFAEATDGLYAAMTDASPTAFALLLVGAGVAGVFLWRSSIQAFRRIDLLDLPPNPPAWMRS